jgi:succinoglycan biosynthesis protein ExoO
LGQTDPRVEVLVIDDASTDDTVAIATEIARQDGRVHVLRNRVNSGPAAARNKGLRQARGDWIALLDADDMLLPHRLDRGR